MLAHRAHDLRDQTRDDMDYLATMAELHVEEYMSNEFLSTDSRFTTLLRCPVYYKLYTKYYKQELKLITPKEPRKVFRYLVTWTWSDKLLEKSGLNVSEFHRDMLEYVKSIPTRQPAVDRDLCYLDVVEEHGTDNDRYHLHSNLISFKKMDKSRFTSYSRRYGNVHWSVSKKLAVQYGLEYLDKETDVIVIVSQRQPI